VPEEVAGAGLVDAAAIHEFPDPGAEVGGGDAGAVTAEEERGLAGEVGEVGAGCREEAVEPGGGARADRDQPGLVEFPLADVEGAGVDME